MDIFDILGISQVIDWAKEKILNKEEKYEPTEVNQVKFNYRPQFLTQYIGQERAKDLVNLTLQKIREIKPVHIIISGNKGAGKSTLANIIANELDFPITWHIGGAFTQKALINFLAKNQDAKPPQILFIDEIHNLPKELAEFMYPILEDFILPTGDNLKIRPFLFIGATTEKNTLIKKFAPLVDRCGADIVLEKYSVEDIKKILKQYNDQIYKVNVTEEVYDILAVNTRFTPRIALTYFDDFIITRDVARVLNAHRVVENGLTLTDIAILEHLKEIDKPVGIEALAMVGEIAREDFTYLIEPYLIVSGYMSRTARGRIVTIKGKELIQKIGGKRCI